MKFLPFLVVLFICLFSCEIDDDFTAPRVYTLCESGQIISPIARVGETPQAISSLPESVRAYVASEFAGYKIENASEFSSASGEIFLAIVMDNSGTLLFDKSGNFLCGDSSFTRGSRRDDEDNIRIEDLPQKILDYIADKYPEIEIYSAEEDDDEFKVSLVNNKVLYFDENGNFLREKG